MGEHWLSMCKAEGSVHTLKCWKQNFLQRSTLVTLGDGAIPPAGTEEAIEARDRPRDTLHQGTAFCSPSKRSLRSPRKSPAKEK